MKTLTVGSSGPHVKTLQKRLNEHGFQLAVDGKLGPTTGAAIVEAKHALGFPASECLPLAGDHLMAVLAKTTKRSLRHRVVAFKRKTVPNRNAVIRGKVVAFAHWAVQNTAHIHYAEIRPIPHVQPGRLPQLPFTTDCSGFVTMAYQWAGAPDPNAANYNGQGFTGTLLRAAKSILRVSQARPGDPIVYGPDTGWHTAIVLEAGPDPLTASHGSEDGPKYEHVSRDGRQPQRICQTL